MDLEIVGRHALLFDDDATAEAVNSGASLVPWAAAGAADTLLDRHDVRHLLDRVPPRPRRAYSAALLSAPSPDGVSEAELDRERFLDLPAGDGGGGDEGSRDAPPSEMGALILVDEHLYSHQVRDMTNNGQADYKAVQFSYGNSTGADDPNSMSSYYHPSFHVPESLLNKLMPPSEKVHQIIARTALFVSEHGGQSEIVLRVKQGSNPTFGFLMPDHHLHSYFRYLVDRPQLLKDDSDASDTNKVDKIANSGSEHTSSGGALSLLGTAYDSEDDEEGTCPASSKGMDPGNSTSADVQGRGKSVPTISDNKVGKVQAATAESATTVKGKPILTKKNPMLTGNSIVASHREKGKDTVVASTTGKSQNSSSGLSETKELILEPPSFMKRTMEKIVEFIIKNGKEFEDKLIEQDRTTGRFPFLLSSNPYRSYYLKMLQEAQEFKCCSRSPEHKGRRSSDRKDRRSPCERKDSSHGKEETRGKSGPTTGLGSTASDRSSAEPSERHGKGKLQMVIGEVKKEAPRKVTADEAAAIVMAATRGVGLANDPFNTGKHVRGNVQTRGSNDHSSSFGSFSSLQDPDVPAKHTSNNEPDTSLTSSGQPKKERVGIIDDDWIASTIAKAAAVVASKEADSSEASMTKEQKLKADRLRRAKMFAAIIKSGGNNLAAAAEPINEPAKGCPVDMDVSTSDLQPLAKEREGSSAPFEREGSNATKQEKDSDDEQNRVRKYRKKHHPESDEEKDDSEESYKKSRKRHRSDHSRGHSKDASAHRHKRKSHSKDREPRNHRHRDSSSEDEHEHRSSKSRHRRRGDDHYSDDDDDHERERRRRDHQYSAKRKHEDHRDLDEQTFGGLEASPSTSGVKFESEKPSDDAAQSSDTTTEVPSELRAKIRAMLRGTL
ncbi:hypothetical protein ACP4OV_030306 [Aristida adscensionis]